MTTEKMNERRSASSARSLANHALPLKNGRGFAAFLLLVFLVIGGAGIRLTSLDSVVRRSPDERTYTWEANTVLSSGMDGIRTLAAQFYATPSNFDYPPPSRVGFIWLLARVMDATGNTTPQAGAWLSCAASILSLLLVAGIGWKFFGPRIAIVALLFYSVSPVALSIARRAWEEAVIELLALVIILLASLIVAADRGGDAAGMRHKFLSRENSRGFLVFVTLLYLCAGAFCVTVKETAVLAFAACSFWVLGAALRRREWAKSAIFSLCCMAAAGSAWLWVAHYFGGPRGLIDLTVSSNRAHVLNSYAIHYESGSGIELLYALWFLSPAVVTLAAVTAAGSWRKGATDSACRENSFVILLFLPIVFMLLAQVAGSYRMSLRLTSLSTGPLCLLAAYGLCHGFTAFARHLDTLERRVVAGLAIAGVLLAAAADYETFQRIFVQQDLQDLSLKMVLDATGQGGWEPMAAPDSFPASAGILSDAQQHTAAEWLSFSAQLLHAGKYEESIAASRHLLQLQPDSAEAYNNIAAAYEEMHDWDSAIAAARQSIRLRPDFQLAKNNLAWSLEQKSKSAR